MSRSSPVEDILEIERLVNRYALLNDTFQVEELVALFTPEAYFDMVPAGLERYQGREAIREFFLKEKRALSHLMHLTANHLIELAGDRATGTAYFLAMGITRRGGVENHARGYYEDSYVRAAEGWRFAARSSNPLLPFEPIRKPVSR